MTPIKFEDTFDFEGGRASGLCSRLLETDNSGRNNAHAVRLIEIAKRPTLKANISKVKKGQAIQVASQGFSSTNVKFKESVYSEDVNFDALLAELAADAANPKKRPASDSEFGDLIGGSNKR